MKQFIVLYHAAKSAQEKMQKSSPEDAAKGMEAWMVWAKKCGDALTDMGAPLGNGQKMTGGSSDKGVVGYSMMQAEDMDAVKALLTEHPHMGWDADCDIEVHEVQPMPGQ